MKTEFFIQRDADKERAKLKIEDYENKINLLYYKYCEINVLLHCKIRKTP